MKLILAPMATLSHTAFRCLIEKFSGCNEYYTEMINAPSLLNGGPYEKYYVDSSPAPEKIVWQLVGKNEESIVEAAKILCENEAIGIDINMGCSAPEIVKSGAGIAWMKKPLKETESLVASFRKALDEYEKNSGFHKRLSVKCRLGADNFTDKQFFDFIEMLVNHGVEQIALHPRTEKEKYRDKPRYIYVQKLCEKYKGKNVNIVANGDIFDKMSLQKVQAICPDCSSFMIGRAAVQKSWIFAELKRSEKDSSSALGMTEQIDFQEIAFDFIENVEKYQPPEFYKTRLQRFFTYYSKNFSFKHYFKTKLLNCKTPEECKTQIVEYFKKVPSDRWRSL